LVEIISLGSMGTVFRSLTQEARNKVVARIMNVILIIRFIVFNFKELE